MNNSNQDITFQEIMPEIARVLKEKRVQMGLTQTQIADKMDTTQSAIARLESGKHNPLLVTLLKYASIVNVKFKIELCEEN